MRRCHYAKAAILWPRAISAHPYKMHCKVQGDALIMAESVFLVFFSLSSIFPATSRASKTIRILDANPWRGACGPPLSHSETPPVVSAVASRLASRNCCHKALQSMPEAGDWENNVGSPCKNSPVTSGNTGPRPSLCVSLIGSRNKHIVEGDLKEQNFFFLNRKCKSLFNS